MSEISDTKLNKYIQSVERRKCYGKMRDLYEDNTDIMLKVTYVNVPCMKNTN